MADTYTCEDCGRAFDGDSCTACYIEWMNERQADALRIQKERAELCKRIIEWWESRPVHVDATMHAFTAEFQSIK